MRILRYMVLALLFLLLVVIIVGFFLPAKVHLERSTIINRDSGTVFKVINSLSNFNKWSPWYEYDTNAAYTLTGPESGVGSKLSWQGNEKIGKGSNEIIESKDDEYIKTKFYFGKSESPAFSKISLTNVDNGTKVTWALDNDFGYNVFYRYFGFVLEKMIAPEYEKGLSNLKAHLESQPIHDFSTISIVETKAEKVYTYQASANTENNPVEEVIGMAFGKIVYFLTENKIDMAGTPKLINVNHTNNRLEFVAAIPVTSNDVVDETGEIVAGLTYQGRAIKLIHVGSYDKFGESYQLIQAYIDENNLQKEGPPWEDFVTDPTLVKPEELTTHIYQPVK